jgi:hemoglobin
MSIFEAVGGEATFYDLVERFYAEVQTDPILRPMYPSTLDASKRHLALFLIQFFGGPRTYIAERGHPRLRARHLPFPIDQRARDAWLSHMSTAVDQMNLPEAAREEFLRYFEGAADFLINQEN